MFSKRFSFIARLRRPLLALFLATLLTCMLISVRFGSTRHFNITGKSDISDRLKPDNDKNALLIDLDCLDRLARFQACREPLKVAKIQRGDAQRVPKIAGEDDLILIDDGHVDYFLFWALENDTIVKRATPKFPMHDDVLVPVLNGSARTLRVPHDPSLFTLHWRASHFLECRNLSVWRAEERTLPLASLEILSRLRQVCEQFGTLPMLVGGTRLGWYRECDVIPHTHDYDTTIQSEHFSVRLGRALADAFELVYFFGALSDSAEFTFRDRRHGQRLDVWLNYPLNGTHDYLVALQWSPNHQMFYQYPRVRELCAGALHGRIVHVACNAEELVKMDYGDDWDVSKPDYNYAAQALNVRLSAVFDNSAFDALKHTSFP